MVGQTAVLKRNDTSFVYYLVSTKICIRLLLTTLRGVYLMCDPTSNISSNIDSKRMRPKENLYLLKYPPPPEHPKICEYETSVPLNLYLRMYILACFVKFQSEVNWELDSINLSLQFVLFCHAKAWLLFLTRWHRLAVKRKGGIGNVFYHKQGLYEGVFQN